MVTSAASRVYAPDVRSTAPGPTPFDSELSIVRANSSFLTCPTPSVAVIVNVCFPAAYSSPLIDHSPVPVHGPGEHAPLGVPTSLPSIASAIDATPELLTPDPSVALT